MIKIDASINGVATQLLFNENQVKLVDCYNGSVLLSFENNLKFQCILESNQFEDFINKSECNKFSHAEFWSQIENVSFSDAFIIKHFEKLLFSDFFECSQISEKLILELKNNKEYKDLFESKFIKGSKLSDKFILKNINRKFDNLICQYQNLSEAFLKKNWKRFGFNNIIILKHQKLSEEFIKEYYELNSSEEIEACIKNQLISESFIEELSAKGEFILKDQGRLLIHWAITKNKLSDEFYYRNKDKIKSFHFLEHQQNNISEKLIIELLKDIDSPQDRRHLAGKSNDFVIEQLIIEDITLVSYVKNPSENIKNLIKLLNL